jgi:exosortase H (IPTLxxWG-CTERM-specific)
MRGKVHRFRGFVRLVLAPTPAGFYVRVLLLVPLLVAATLAKPFKDFVELPLMRAVAWTSHRLLRLLGTEVRLRDRYLVSSDGISLEIVSGCTGIFVFLLFLAVVLAFPARWRERLRGVAVAAVLISVLNHVRIVTLFYIGRTFPELFEELHVYVWQGILVLAVALYWYLWATRCSSVRAAP